MHPTKKYWFVSKRYGYGWRPASKEGWIVTLLYIVSILLPSLILSRIRSKDELTLSLFPYFAVSTAILLLICYVKGESLRWRWGDNTKEK